jgi:RHS repeat-associated protein
MKKLRFLSLPLIFALLCNSTVLAFHAPPWDTGHNSFSGDPGDTNTDPGTCDGSCGSCPCTGKAMSPVEAASGDFIYNLRVMLISGLGPSLDVTLTYNSQDLRRGPFGVGWVNPYDQHITETTDGNDIFAIYSLPNGKRERFKRNQDSTYATPPRLFATLTKSSDGTFTLRDKFGIVRRFSAQGQLAAIVDRNGNALTLTYDVAGFMNKITDASSRSVTLTKGADGRVESMTDPANRAFRFAYDTSGNLTRYTDPLGNIATYQYDSANNMTAVVDPRGNTLTRLIYDSTGRVSQHVDGAETWTYTYSPSTKRTIKRDSQSNTWTFDYNDNGNITREADPGGIEQFTVDANLNVTQYVDKGGNTTKYTYDATGNRLTSANALNNISTTTYEPVFNRPLTVKDALGNTARFEYDAKGNLTKTTNVLGQVTKFEYDGKGQLIRLTDALANSFDFAYDSQGNLVKITDPLGNNQTASFNILGRIVTTTDAAGLTTQFAYDNNERLVRSINANGGVTIREYDASSNLTGIAIPNSAKTSLEYDSLNRLTKVINALGQSTNYTYDRRGNLASKIDPKGQSITYAYDALDRRIRKTKPDDTVSYSYDGPGNLINLIDGDSSLSFAYDKVNRLTTARTAATVGQPTTTVAISYDANGNRKSLTDPSGGVTNYTYDALQRLKSLTDPAGTFAFSYDEISRRTRVDRPLGISTVYTYDASRRLMSLANQGGPGVGSINYTYDRSGKRLTKTDSAGLQSYSYDSLDRLTSAITQTNPAESYSYDSVGNRTVSHSSTSYSYNLANRLTADSRFDYLYDANGNLTRKTERVTGNITTYTYDSDNELVRIDFSDGTNATYRYDGMGRRIEKNVGGQITRYIYDGQDILFEYAGASLAARYTHGPGMDEVLGVQRSGNTYLFQTDALGSVARVIDGGGVKASYSYDAFGRIVAQSGARQGPFGFHGREFDQESGLYYFRARYYDPQVGRFITEDPIKFAGGVNFYSFVDGNPINVIDPYGKQAIAAGTAATTTGLVWGAAAFDPELVTKAVLITAALGLSAWVIWHAAESANDDGKSESKDGEKCPGPAPAKEGSPEDFPDNPDDWIPPEGVTEEPRASEATGGKHRQWKDENGNIVRRWDRGQPGQPGWKGRDHWNTPGGDHIPTKPR